MNPRVLYVPNELDDFRQVGVRRPLANLLDCGLIEDVSVFSLKWRIQQGTARPVALEQLVDRVQEFQPTILLAQHLGGTGLRGRHFRRMRAAADYKFIYHEADPYLRPWHPLPREAVLAGRDADVVYTVGAGEFARAFRRGGARDVRWEPSPFDSERYEFKPAVSRNQHEYDVVIVANRNRPRWRGLPGWRDRISFVEMMQRRFGSRLAIFGKGWEGVSAKGPIDFSEQTAAISLAPISANWDHFPEEPRYFSNRLPISLAAGSIHATTHHPGYEDIFGEAIGNFLLTAARGEDLARKIEGELNTMDDSRWMRASQAARRFAHAHFRQDDQLLRFLNAAASGPIVAGRFERWNESGAMAAGL